MIQENATTKASMRGNACPFAFAMAFLGLIAACTHSLPGPERPSEVLSTDCAEWGQVQEPLANLGLRALEAYGRFDPGMYVIDAESGALHVSEVQPARKDIDSFRVALDSVTSNALARAALARGYQKALEICGDGRCPATAYPIAIHQLRGAAPTDQVFEWIVEPPNFPSANQVKAFIALYSPRPSFCPLLPSLAVRSLATGMAQVQGRDGAVRRSHDEVSLKNPCPCWLTGSYGTPGCGNCSYAFQCGTMGEVLE